MEWYVARNGTTVGPVTFDQLADAARTGRLNRDDLVWNDNMESWVPAATVPDLWHEPERKPPRSVWRRAPKTSVGRGDAGPIRQMTEGSFVSNVGYSCLRLASHSSRWLSHCSPYSGSALSGERGRALLRRLSRWRVLGHCLQPGRALPPRFSPTSGRLSRAAV